VKDFLHILLVGRGQASGQSKCKEIKRADKISLSRLTQWIQVSAGEIDIVPLGKGVRHHRAVGLTV
jgi:hypothetical protein